MHNCKPYCTVRPSRDKIRYLLLKKTIKGIGKSLWKDPSFYVTQNSCPELNSATDNKGLHTIHTWKRSHWRLSPYVKLVSCRERELNAFLPFKATISFKAQRLTSWPQRDLEKRLRTRASENSLRTAISSSLELNRTSLWQNTQQGRQWRRKSND